ncbi:unnamed protein product, partial [Rotaria magnacalcarata]
MLTRNISVTAAAEQYYNPELVKLIDENGTKPELALQHMGLTDNDMIIVANTLRGNKVVKKNSRQILTSASTLSSNEKEEWTCERCTLLNNVSTNICEACSLSRPLSRLNITNCDTPASTEWGCEQCTLLNKASVTICDACAASRPSPPPSFNVSVFETKDQSQSDDDESNHAQDKPS